MNLQTLLSALQKYEASGPLDLEVSGISYTSKTVRKGHLFAALPGVHHHGLEFLKQAEKAGAVAILTDKKSDTKVSQIVTEQPRLALAAVSNIFYEKPSTKLRLFGVTGTNGKTTSTYLLRSVMQAAGMKCGILGTVVYSGGKFKEPSSLTTPESLDLQALLASMVSQGDEACAMEVSSHSLVQHRVAYCDFEASIFTNLTQDHLDFHHTMEEYFAAKKMLFDNQFCKTKLAVINKDDPYGRRLLDERKIAGLQSFSFGFGRGCAYKVHKWTSSASGSEIVIRHLNKDTKVKTPLLAKYNAYNIAGVYTAAIVSGIDKEHVIAGIENMKQVPGRLEKIDLGQPYLLFIDYAHTEDAMRQLLLTLRSYTKERLIILFGCGGDRDRGKRPLMGRVAGELADEVILTSDNPRHEDPQEIIKDVKAGVEVSGNTNLHTFVDRKEAIEKAVALARPGDTIVLAGKGHENYQVIGDTKEHFDEREILKELLSKS